MSTSLLWSPIYKVIEDRIKSGDEMVLILVPFVKLAALQQLHWVHADKPKLKIICRWRPEDLAFGASDVEVFKYLKDLGCQLYINPSIHLKLYVFGSNSAFSTSGNLTLKGLGYSDDANIEVGSFVTLTNQDWARIFGLIDASYQVDDELYHRFKDFVDQQPKLGPTIAFPNLLPPRKLYTISSLPASVSPGKLADFYFNGASSQFTAEEARRAVHDLVTFRVAEGLSPDHFENNLRTAFLKTPFVVAFIELLKTEATLRFGAVNNWIHDTCEDVPLPYRWEIKENTRIFYDWLAHFIPQITWDRPRHSQIIRWQNQ